MKKPSLTDFEGLGPDVDATPDVVIDATSPAHDFAKATDPEPTRFPDTPLAIVNREAWLSALTDCLRSHFADAGEYVIPSNVRMAIGFCSTGRKSKRIGECWASDASGDGTIEIFIKATLADPIEVGAVLVHELVHATVGNEHGHGKVFKACALAVGLTGKMTATIAGDALKATLADMVATIGPLPHASLGAGLSSGPRKQAARMIKCVCEECGYLARTAKAWIETVGPPHCPEHGAMSVQ